ncbi:MAG: hypothetical protein KGZ63_14655 [Clostridiales bacterium]|jgi:hypothetical protein|nr:hypothetical protein [Clostridiales bacterium]
MKTLSQTLSELRKEMEDCQEPTASETWLPEQGDILVGKVREIKEVTTKFGQRDTMVVETEHGQIKTVFATTDIKRKLESLKAEIGDIVALKYFGEKQTRNGATFKSYEVRVIKTDITCTDQLAEGVNELSEDDIVF